MSKNTKQKTHALTADGNTYESGWRSDDRRFDSTISPERVISTTKFGFAEHNFDKKLGLTSISGSNYASHVEARALCDVRGDIAILVSRKMCKSSEKFVEYLAKERKVTYTVGTLDSIHIFSEEGVIKRDSAQGKTCAGMKWSMRHEGQKRATMHVEHPVGDPTVEQTVYSVLSEWSDPSNTEGPIAYFERTHFDKVVEKSTYFESKDTHIQTVFPTTRKMASTHIGPSGGVQDHLRDDN